MDYIHVTDDYTDYIRLQRLHMITFNYNDYMAITHDYMAITHDYMAITHDYM